MKDHIKLKRRIILKLRLEKHSDVSTENEEFGSRQIKEKSNYC